MEIQDEIQYSITVQKNAGNYLDEIDLEGLLDKEEFTKILLNVQRTEEQSKLLTKLLLHKRNDEKFNKVFRITIKGYSRQYEKDNLLKQVLFYTLLSEGNKSRAGSLRSALNKIETYEIKLNKSFKNFNLNEINESISYLNELKISPRTIATYRTSLRFAVDKTNQLLVTNNLISQNDIFKNYWNSPLKGLNVMKQVKLFTYNEMMNNVFESKYLPDSLVVLLLFKGVKLPTITEDKKGLGEIRHLKKSDLNGNVLTIHGKYGDRTIEFNRKEMYIVNYALSITIGENFVGNANKSASSMPNGISRYGVEQRLKRLSNAIYNDPTYLKPSWIRNSGRLYWINREAERRYGTIDINESQLRGLILKSFEAFGDYSKEEINDVKTVSSNAVYRATRKVVRLRENYFQ